MAPEHQWSFCGDSDPPESDLNDQFGTISRENTESPKIVHQLESKELELTHKGITKSISTLSNSSQASITSSIINVLNSLYILFNFLQCHFLVYGIYLVSL